MSNRWMIGVMSMIVMGFAAFACDRPLQASEQLPAPKEDLAPPVEGEATERTAVFAAGCFWCVEAVFEQLEGVKSVESGYAGGSEETAKYNAVAAGETKHAEAVRITYDSSRITYGQLLRVFFATHDPTTKDRQGPDWGHQYRSAIFYDSDDQKRVAAAYIGQLEASKRFAPKPIVTTLEALDTFYPAEEYHQDFMLRNPSHPYVLQWAVPKVQKVRTGFAEQVKETEQVERRE